MLTYQHIDMYGLNKQEDIKGDTEAKRNLINDPVGIFVCGHAGVCAPDQGDSHYGTDIYAQFIHTGRGVFYYTAKEGIAVWGE